LHTASGLQVSAEAGLLNVLENRNRDRSRRIQLAFVRLTSHAENPSAPVIFLAGGPGDSATAHATDPEALERWLPFLEVCDVILLDQRGCGRSKPGLRWTWDGPPPTRVFESQEAAEDHWRAMSRKARAELIRQGFDLDGYTTVQMADDVDDLRRALRLERVSLLGFSFGTHLALATIRRYGEHIESAVLVGVAGPDHLLRLPLLADEHINTLSRLAAQDRFARVPDLNHMITSALKQLDDRPMVVQVVDRNTQKTFDVPVGRFGLSWLLARDLGDTSDVIVFPRLLHDIAKNDPAALQWFVRKRFDFFQQVDAMMMLVRSASGGSANRRAEIDRQAERSVFGSATNFPFTAADEWNAPDLGDEYRSPVVSGVRTLLVSGSLDWNTPAAQAEEVRRGLSNATHLVVENAGHEQLLSHPGVRAAAVDFLSGREVAGQTIAYPAPQFVPLTGSHPGRKHPALPKTASIGWAVVCAASGLGIVAAVVGWRIARHARARVKHESASDACA
jgi:pimeloyl-ACP methyl ester carboxylesterase